MVIAFLFKRETKRSRLFGSVLKYGIDFLIKISTFHFIKFSQESQGERDDFGFPELPILWEIFLHSESFA